MNVPSTSATMATATSTSNKIKPAASACAWRLTRLLFHIVIEDLHPTRQLLDHQGGLLIAIGDEMNDAWLSQPGRMKMCHRIALACFGALGRHHVQDMDVERQGIRPQLPGRLELTRLTLKIAHRHDLPVEVKRQTVDTFRQRRMRLQVTHRTVHHIDGTAQMLPLKRTGETRHHRC